MFDGHTRHLTSNLGRDDCLHFHGTHDKHRIAWLDRVAFLDLELNHDTGQRRAYTTRLRRGLLVMHLLDVGAEVLDGNTAWTRVKLKEHVTHTCGLVEWTKT